MAQAVVVSQDILRLSKQKRKQHMLTCGEENGGEQGPSSSRKQPCRGGAGTANAESGGTARSPGQRKRQGPGGMPEGSGTQNSMQEGGLRSPSTQSLREQIPVGGSGSGRHTLSPQGLRDADAVIPASEVVEAANVCCFCGLEGTGSPEGPLSQVSAAFTSRF